MPRSTEVRFASFLSGGFITAIIVHQERKLAKRTSVRCTLIKGVRPKVNCSYSEMVSRQASLTIYMWCTSIFSMDHSNSYNLQTSH